MHRERISENMIHKSNKTVAKKKKIKFFETLEINAVSHNNARSMYLLK